MVHREASQDQRHSLATPREASACAERNCPMAQKCPPSVAETPKISDFDGQLVVSDFTR